MYTTAEWLHAFFEAVAAADQKHFETRESLAVQALEGVLDRPPASPSPCTGLTGPAAPTGHDELNAALKQEGL
ncbi:MAG: hypothetical protein KF902_06365 [Phycisphaeraceae bacterium]|nr:hypothetical protein [Phycisphaeraceae bacterium]QYK48993.1 MAG: hypothetical protein KF838_03870 [Phycisphaeraceae bacterium]